LHLRSFFIISLLILFLSGTASATNMKNISKIVNVQKHFDDAESSVLTANGRAHFSTDVDRDRTCANAGDNLQNLALLDVRTSSNARL